MIDPANITNFNRTNDELEEFAIFSVLVAGKNSNVIAKRIPEVLCIDTMQTFNFTPFSFLANLGLERTADVLRGAGIAPYNRKARTLTELTNRGFDLRTCSFADLESVWGISYKTSRMIIVHSRPNVRTVIPDTHIRKGINRYFAFDPLPDHPPRNKKEFQRWENRFLYICDKLEREPASLDLEWWREFSGN